MRHLPVGALEKLLKSDQPVYVVNTSKLPSGDKGTILVNFFDGTRREYFKMPPTFIPMAISDVIPKRSLSASKDFKQLLVKGMLTLVDPEDAAEYLESDEAIEEYEDLVLSEHSVRSTSKIESDAKAANRVQKRLDTFSTLPTGNEYMPDEESSEPQDPVSNKVKALVQDLISGARTEKDVKQELKRAASNLTMADLSYVSVNVVNQSATISAWAAEKIGILNGTRQPKKLTGAAAKSAERKAAKAKEVRPESEEEDPAELAKAARNQILDARPSGNY